MNQEPANTNRIGRVDDSPSRVLKHRPTNSSTMVRLRNRKAAEDDDGDRIGHVPPKTARRRCDGDGARSQRVVSDRRPGLAGNERTRRTSQLICASTTLEPFVECRLPTSKAIQSML